MASPKALWEWCRVTCACYPNVEIKNMSTSFRDGLAFCAIIHKHRPDLIDFSSLSKDNGYQNNKLAFEIAETKLGIPALLDPKDIVSPKAPDCLSVITYLSQYYYFFNRKSYGLASLSSSHVTVSYNLAKSKTPDGPKANKSLTDLETSREDRFSNTRPRRVCNLCFKPVHLIQRHLIDGKVCHRSCFRCKVCHSSLLPGSYTQGSDAGSLICTHHITDSKSTRVDVSQQTGPTENRPKCKFQEGSFSLGGLAITSVPHYTETTESDDGLVCATQGTDRKEWQERSRENRGSTVGLKSTVKQPAPSHLPPPVVKDRTVEGAGKVTEGSGGPVPAPRRRLDSSVVLVPAPRTKTTQTMNSSPAAGNSSNQNKCSPNPPGITSPTSGSPNVKTNHPWLTIIHPGPWTQLPPAPPPVPTPRSKSVSNLRGPWHRPRVPPPNPFVGDVDEDIQQEVTKPEPAHQTKPPEAAIHSGNGGNRTDKSGDRDASVCSSDAGHAAVPSMKPDFREAGGAAAPVPAEGVGAATNTGGASSEPVGGASQLGTTDLDETDNTGGSVPDVTEAAAAGPLVTSGEAQGPILPRSLSVPAITSARCQSSFLPVQLTEANDCDQVTSCQSKPACKENPFDRKPAMPKSKTFQGLPSRRARAPGHGFPLIKRKVRTDQNVSPEDLRVEMRELDKHLETLEQRGVELERSLRDCENDKEEEHMLTEWFSLVQERHALVRRDAELVYVTKQQKLEERQADVEYDLRCLLSKPESDWSREDRGLEQRLMEELVAIIEQRNQIISSLDQDRQREREEDMLLEAMMKNEEFQKEGRKELKKSKRKFKLTKVFKMLNHKAERTKDSMDKKS